MTLKHASLGLGLHSLTGQKLPLTILSRLGHCINYDKICEIETAQAELVQHFQSMSMSLPLIPAECGSKVCFNLRFRGQKILAKNFQQF